jgi:hypothetical protein
MPTKPPKISFGQTSPRYAKCDVRATKSGKDRIMITAKAEGRKRDTPVYVWLSRGDALKLISDIALALKKAG